MSFPNSSSRTTKLISPPFQDELDQNYWASCPQEDDENYQQLYMRVPLHTKPKKQSSQDRKGLSYIDKSIALCAPSDPAVLNNKLQKFFKTLTKNYKPTTPQSKEKSPRSAHLSSRQEGGYSPSGVMQNVLHRESPLLMKKNSSREQHKFYNQGIVENGEEEDPLTTRGRIDNMYAKFISQENVKKERGYEDSTINSMRSMSNPAKQIQEEKQMESAGRNKHKLLNVPSQEHSILPCFNQGLGMEDNCNYAYLKNFQKGAEEIHPYQKFVMHQNSSQGSIYDQNLDSKGHPQLSKHNHPSLHRKRDSRETASQSHNSSLKNLDSNEPINISSRKASSKTSDPRKNDIYLSQGNPLINQHFSEREDEFEPYRPSTTLPGVAGVYSSILSDSKDENPNYTNVKHISSQNEIRNEQILSFAKKATSFGTSIQQSSGEHNKLRTLSQVTDLLDSTEEMFTKQKGCFSIFLALNSLVFQRVNSAFQEIKKVTPQTREFNQGNFVSFGEVGRRESAGLNRAIVSQQRDNEAALNMVLQGFVKMSGMVKAVEVAVSRVKQASFERIAHYGTTAQQEYRNRFISGLSLLSTIHRSQCKALVTQSFNTWSTCTKMEKLKEVETTRFQQLVQILSKEKQQLRDELNSIKEQTKITAQQNDLKAFMKGMEAPVGPLRLRKESNESKPSSLSTLTTSKPEENSLKSQRMDSSPLSSQLQISNRVMEGLDPIKMFNGAIKKAFEQDSAKQLRSKPTLSAETMSYNMQENQNKLVDTRKNEPENKFSYQQNYIETLKRQSNGNYENKILSPSSQNCYESHVFDVDSSSKGSRGDVGLKADHGLGKVFAGFGVSPPKELTEEDEFNAESVSRNAGKKNQMSFFESLEGFDHVNVIETFSNDPYRDQKSSVTMDQSEIMKERTGDMRSIREMTNAVLVRDFDESMIGSEGDVSFYRNGMENVMILKREGM